MYFLGCGINQEESQLAQSRQLEEPLFCQPASLPLPGHVSHISSSSLGAGEVH